jgi:putative hydrolase of the HAD superfamily
MELNFRTDIKKYLDKQKELFPITTSFCPNLKPNSDETKKIKAVIFDIYGTLLISSSGDIDQATLNIKHIEEALIAGGFKSTNPKVFDFLLLQLPLKIKSQQNELKENGFPHPDVDIFRVWREMMDEAEKAHLIELSGNESLADTIIVFEILSNPVFPMPAMKEVLNELTKKNIPIGIVSNAQFYTPILMNYFLEGTFTTKQEIRGFDNDLSVFSFKEFRAKPDVLLFQKIKNNLKNKYNINPDEAVFVGNDMLKDTFTAKKAGLQTILFAGDERSLRLREDDKRVKGVFPDYIITELKQLSNIIL